MSSLQTPAQCTEKSMRECDTYRCQVGAIVGTNRNNLTQSQHICEMFPGVDGCVSEQACNAYFPMSTSMYKSCAKTVKCTESKSKSIS